MLEATGLPHDSQFKTIMPVELRTSSSIRAKGYLFLYHRSDTGERQRFRTLHRLAACIRRPKNYPCTPGTLLPRHSCHFRNYPVLRRREIRFALVR